LEKYCSDKFKRKKIPSLDSVEVWGIGMGIDRESLPKFKSMPLPVILLVVVKCPIIP
jgi:hypothetical protein